jgi:hypothetical protein
MPATLGSVTKSVFVNEIESHKLHLEFVVEAGQSVKAGMPVELTATGTVKPVTSATAATTGIGICLQDRAAGEKVTVGVRGYAVENGEAKTALTPGPVFWDSYNATTSLNVWDDTSVTAANIAGWCLDVAATAADPIRVLVKN